MLSGDILSLQIPIEKEKKYWSRILDYVPFECKGKV